MPDPRSILERASRLAADHPLPAEGFLRLVEFRGRRRRVKRVSAAVFALVLVTVTFGWLAWSLTTGDRPRPAREFEGGPPSEVLTRSIAGTCLNAGPAEHRALTQEITLEARSHLLASFTVEWSELDPGEEGRLAIEAAGPSGTDRSDAWTFGAEPDVSTSGTVTWSFEGIGPGTYRVSAVAKVRPSEATGSQPALSAGLQNCALTVFVLPSL